MKDIGLQHGHMAIPSDLDPTSQEILIYCRVDDRLKNVERVASMVRMG